MVFNKKKTTSEGDEFSETDRCLSVVYNRFYLQMNRLNRYMNAFVTGNNTFESAIVETNDNKKTTGFPTVKIDVKNIENRCGSYIATAEICGVRYKCVAFLSKKKGTIEAHLIDCSKKDLVGSVVKLRIIQFIRERQEFNSDKRLIEAISSDIYLTNAYFKHGGANIDDDVVGADGDRRKAQSTLF